MSWQVHGVRARPGFGQQYAQFLTAGSRREVHYFVQGRSRGAGIARGGGLFREKGQDWSRMFRSMIFSAACRRSASGAGWRRGSLRRIHPAGGIGEHLIPIKWNDVKNSDSQLALTQKMPAAPKILSPRRKPMIGCHESASRASKRVGKPTTDLDPGTTPGAGQTGCPRRPVPGDAFR